MNSLLPPYLSLSLALLLCSCTSLPQSRVGWTNSLGMSFVSVPVVNLANPDAATAPKIKFAITETREKDLALIRPLLGSRKRQLLPTTAAAYVSWKEAQLFCEKLTQHERANGTITNKQRYRLPTDHEWSCAVGIGQLEDPLQVPEEKNNKLEGYPWGSAWPPPAGAGNYCGEEARGFYPQEVLQGYRDLQAIGAARAGTSQPNVRGLRDLGGNLWEWCEDLYRPGTNWRVLRGGAWTSHRPPTMASSHRTHDPENYRSDSVGFRCVLAEDL
jgi:formylglycine-generating enzyme required for sulfatase activity